MLGRHPEIVLVRHGETAWSRSGQHTGRSDIPLTPEGEETARGLSARLQGRSFTSIWTSPSQRARTTCVLAGFGTAADIKQDLAEWDYGAYEGRTTTDILKERPDWRLFRDGWPGGEAATDVGIRADRVIADARKIEDDLLIFSSAHFLRVLAARWVGLPPTSGSLLILGTASISKLGYEHDLTEPVLRSWNTQT